MPQLQFPSPYFPPFPILWCFNLQFLKLIHDPQDIGSILTSSFISKFHYMFCYIFSHLLIFIKFGLIHQITQRFVNSYTFSSHFYFKLNLFIARILVCVCIYIYWIEQGSFQCRLYLGSYNNVYSKILFVSLYQGF